VQFLPAYGRQLSDALHQHGFTLDSTRYMHASFGSRELLFVHPHARLWLRMFYDGKEGEWQVDLGHAENRGPPPSWQPARNWARWAGQAPSPDAAVVAWLATGIPAILARLKGMGPRAVTSQVAGALNAARA
jgi:hypothetical protein